MAHNDSFVHRWLRRSISIIEFTYETTLTANPQPSNIKESTVHCWHCIHYLRRRVSALQMYLTYLLTRNMQVFQRAIKSQQISPSHDIKPKQKSRWAEKYESQSENREVSSVNREINRVLTNSRPRIHRRRLRGCFGDRADVGKIMWLLSAHRNLSPFCKFLNQNTWALCAYAIVSWTALKLL